MGKNQWVLQKLDPDEGDDAEWVQFNLGIIEDGMFRVEASTFSEEMALKLLSAIQWLEDLEEFTIRAAAPPVIKPRARRKTRSTK